MLCLQPDRRPLPPPLRPAEPARRARLLLGVSLGALLAGPAAHAAGSAAPAAAPALSPAWFAARQGGRAGVNGSSAGGAAAPSLAGVAQSIANMRQAAQAIAAASALQSQAHAAALLAPPSSVPDGLAAGGLLPAPNAAANTALWRGANLPTQSASGGRTKVTVQQTKPQAILNWSSFNVGRNTDLTFDQSAGDQSAGDQSAGGQSAGGQSAGKQAAAAAGGRAANTWTVLNRVQASVAPSQILGSVAAQGQVLVVNQNGILFGGGSQINVSSLVASAGNITDARFLAATSGAASGGIYGSGAADYFTDVNAPVTTAPGSVIATYAPATAATRGGFVLMIGSGVATGGQITTPDGQTELAAGSAVALAPGFARDANNPNGTTSTTLGNVVTVGGMGGIVSNTGLIQATTGDVTLSGKTVVQGGVVASTTSVTQRGTVHLVADAEKGAAVTLAPGGTTLITPDLAPAAAVDSSRALQFTPTATVVNGQTVEVSPSFSLDAQRGGIPDRSDLSRIEITSGAGVEFQGGSLTLATGGQIAVTAGTRVQVDSLALIDAAGALGAVLPAGANALLINVQGFQLRDAPTNRDTGALSSAQVTVDASQLVLVPAQPDPAKPGYDPSPRYYTPGGLLEVSGELGNVAHTISEWLSPGGVVTFAANEVVAQTGAVVNIAGGAIRHQAGTVATTWLTSASGRIYNINTAPAAVLYTGVYTPPAETQPRWGVSKTFASALVAPPQTFEPAYTVGRDGGDLVISAPTAVFEATVNAGIVSGERQTAARPAASAYSVTNLFDPYALPQTAAPVGGGLLIGNYLVSADALPRTSSASVAQSLPTSAGADVTIGDAAPPLADALTAATAIPAARVDTIDLSAAGLSASGLGALSVTTAGTVAVAAPLTLGPGGTVTVIAPSFTLSSALTARGGGVSVTNVFAGQPTAYLDAVAAPVLPTVLPTSPAGGAPAPAGKPVPFVTPGITLTATAAIDTRGAWTNAYLDPSTLSGEAFANGGAVTLDTSQTLVLAAGSRIDASAGGALSPALAQTGGAGGAIALVSFDRNDLSPLAPRIVSGTTASVPRASGPNALETASFGATLASAGFQGAGGGTLTIDAPSIAIGDPGPVAGFALTLPSAFFQSGFSFYRLNGYGAAGVATAAGTRVGAAPGVSVAAGTNVAVTEPVYMVGASAQSVPTGGDPAAAFSFGLPPLYLPNPSTARLTQRLGASLTLSSEPDAADLLYATTGPVIVGDKATLTVDPLAGVVVQGNSQVTVLGTIRAPGGAIGVLDTRSQALDPANLTFVPGLSVWLGPDAVLDAAGDAATAADFRGRPYGTVHNGGTITLGAVAGAGPLSGSPAPFSTTDAFVVARPGSAIDASGASARLDPNAGQAAPAGAQVSPAPVTVASDAGSIAVDTSSGAYLDGALRAAAGGANASGGSLSVTLVTPDYGRGSLQSTLPYVVPGQVAVPREIVVSQSVQLSPLPAFLAPGQTAGLLAGRVAVSAQLTQSGGFDTLALASSDAIVFNGDVSLGARQSVSLTAGVVGDSAKAGLATVSAPYVQLGGLQPATPTGGVNISGDTIGFALGASAAPAWNASLAPTGSAPTGSAPTGSALTVSARLVDVSGSLFDGVSQDFTYSDPAGAHPASFQVPGFRTIAVASAGDVRFMPAAAGSAAGASTVSALIAPGNVVIDAAQVYPAQGVSGAVVAGFGPGPGPDIGARSGPPPYGFVLGEGIAVAGAGALPQAPLTANGTLTLAAGTIVQGGVVRAPDGVLQLGVSATDQLPAAIRGVFAQTLATSRLVLAAGSTTSASGLGTEIPYGGTPDGVSYTVNNLPVTTQTATITVPVVTPLSSAVTLAATSVAIQPGAVVDVRGGGELSGAGFVSGRGGSTDVLGTPLPTFSPASGTYAANAADRVYAVLPGAGPYAAPAAAANPLDAGAPAAGSQITLAASAAGLAAGTYTLLPAIDALLPGAFRVEIGATTLLPAGTVTALGNGSVQVGGALGVANTGVRESLPSLVTVTPGSAVRAYSSYTETTYSQFVLSQAALFGVTRSDLPADAKRLVVALAGTPLAPVSSLSVQGGVLTQPGPGGYGAEVDVAASLPLTITPDARPSGAAEIYVQASALDALDAATLSIGGYAFAPTPGLPGRSFAPGAPLGVASASGLQGLAGVGSGGVTLASGATLAAAEVFLVAQSGGVTIEQGGTIDTIGRGAPPLSGTPGLTYQNAGSAVVAVSNGQTIFQAPTDVAQNTPSAPVAIGACAAGDLCGGATGLFSEGSLTFSTTGAATVADGVRYGARSIDFSVPAVNIGGAAALAQAVVPPGLTLTQATLSTLLAGDPSVGAPPLQSLILTANQGVNFYGSVSLNTLDPATGRSSLQQFVLNTPSIYGFGGPADAVTVTTGTLTWNGIAATAQAGNTTRAVSAPAAGVIAGGPGTGAGSLTVAAQNIVLGYGSTAQPDRNVSLDRTLLGFSAVTLQAGGSISAADTGTLSAYQSQTYTPGAGFAGAGGTLTLATPLLTGAAGSTLTVTSGGALTVRPPAGMAASTARGGTSGASITLNAGGALDVASAIVAPSGRLALNAAGDVTLEAGSRLDVSGRTETLVDASVYGFGGTVSVTSAAGNVVQKAGAAVDVSATGNAAGAATFDATAPAAGAVTLDGAILGASTPAGGASYTAGSVTVDAQSLAAGGAADALAALNRTLDAGGVYGARSFDLHTGSYTIAGTMKAASVSVSADAGSLTVTGTVDASGAKPGAISLSAHDGLTVSGRLLAGSGVLQVDSAGAPIASENRATVELTSAAGAITLAPGAAIDVGDADGVARGTVTLNAPRTPTGAAVSAPGPLSVTGAASIVVDGFRTYVPSDAAGTILQSSVSVPLGGAPAGAVDLVATNMDSMAWVASASTAGLAGLTAHGAAFHLRPGVEVDGSAASGGNLTVQGDLDLALFRYGPGAKTDGSGAGEPGALTLRAANNLNVYGSITDGFAPPSDSVTTIETITSTVTTEVIKNGNMLRPVSKTTAPPVTQPPVSVTMLNPDDNGFVLLTGNPTGLTQDVILPVAVGLAGGTAAGTSFTVSNEALNFAIPIGAEPGGSGPALQSNVRLPANITTGAAYVIPPGTVVRAPILDAGGKTLFAAGTLIGPAAAGASVPAGSVVSAGNILPTTQADPLVVAPGTVWPAGASLGAFASPQVYLPASGATAPAGALLPGGTVIAAAAGDATVTLPDGQAGIPLRGQAAGPQGAIQGSVYAIGQLLPAGTASWSLRLVSGADLGAADQRATQPVLAPGQSGTLTLSDPHVQASDVASLGSLFSAAAYYQSAELSVVRTGTGDLGLFAGGGIQEGSPFGIYTAGAQTAPSAADDAARQTVAAPSAGLAPTVLGYVNSSPPNQIVFGPKKRTGSTTLQTETITQQSIQSTSPYESLVTGANYRAEYPAGGGNVTVYARGDVTGYQLPDASNEPRSSSDVGTWLWRQGGAGGLPSAWWINFGTYVPVATSGGSGTQSATVYSASLAGFTGIGALGGGDLSIAAGGDAGGVALVGSGQYQARGLDVAVASTGQVAGGVLTQTGGGALSISVGGAFSTLQASNVTDLRGTVGVQAGSIGRIAPVTDVNASPAQSAILATVGASTGGGLTLTPGDATAGVAARGDLVLVNVADATLGATVGPSASSYSLWRPTTQVDLSSAGGDVAPGGIVTSAAFPYYPPIFRVTAASGSVYGANFTLAPSPAGQLELLAYASVLPLTSLYNDTVAVSGADPASLSSPLQPAYAGAPGLSAGVTGPFAFGPDTATGALHAGDGAPALIYAATGDVIDLSYGETAPAAAGSAAAGEFVSGKAVRIVAGRDVVNLGRKAPPLAPPPGGIGAPATVIGAGSPALIVNSNASDVSVVQAGRDVIYPLVQVAGPGQLFVQAGRDLYLGNQGFLQSIQPLTPRTAGAGITAAAGTTAAGPDWSGFAARYLDPSVAADAPYLATLDSELTAAYGVSGAPAADAAFLSALSPQAQGALIDPIYFDLLRTSGREFNNPASLHYRSYVTGRQAIAALFPATDAAGAPIAYSGAITFFPPLSGPGPFIRTDFGGDVNLLAPGGEVLVGSNSIPSPGGQGVLTQGMGNVDVYALGSVLLGQSRIFTTFGGGVTIWSAEGDINAGRGAGGTQAFSPVSIVYDGYGDVTVSPSTTTTGAGIATLAPIAGVPPGDVDLVAPMGTIDAGEAGIRVSGNVNLAALTIANAANIQVAGKTTGVPTVAVPNVAATLATNAATAGTDQAAEEERRRQREQQQPAASLITVEVTDFGG